MKLSNGSLIESFVCNQFSDCPISLIALLIQQHKTAEEVSHATQLIIKVCRYIIVSQESHHHIFTLNAERD